ncbi:hypothetical protein [Bradyrhizobium genosp. P]|uniref:hypothetical protein n=1 Tax=Bradyrhizobium genosp. P TaxID=83641 RepID=UPI003CED7C9A
MATTFTLKIDLAGHEQPHAPQAHRRLVAQMLDQARQSLTSSNTMRGELTIAAPGMPTKTLGGWEFVDE